MSGHSGGTPRRRACFAAAPAMVVAAALAGCAGEFSTLDPGGPAAARVADLWWVMLAGALLILTGVMGTALYTLRRSRAAPDFSDRKVLVGWGLVFPIVTLTALMVFALAKGEQLFGRQPADLEVAAHARQFAWEFTYADGTTSPILHVAAGSPFRLAITSEDVIHSFWVPRLGGKMDAVPGKENVMVLTADAPGLYRGLCAEYCGVGHAHMMFELRAHDPADLVAAIAAEQEPGAPLPVLVPRAEPASARIAEAARLVRRWLGWSE